MFEPIEGILRYYSPIKRFYILYYDYGIISMEDFIGKIVLGDSWNRRLNIKLHIKKDSELYRRFQKDYLLSELIVMGKELDALLMRELVDYFIKNVKSIIVNYRGKETIYKVSKNNYFEEKLFSLINEEMNFNIDNYEIKYPIRLSTYRINRLFYIETKKFNGFVGTTNTDKLFILTPYTNGMKPMVKSDVENNKVYLMKENVSHSFDKIDFYYDDSYLNKSKFRYVPYYRANEIYIGETPKRVKQKYLPIFDNNRIVPFIDSNTKFHISSEGPMFVYAEVKR